jgi:hypothetical protein
MVQRRWFLFVLVLVFSLVPLAETASAQEASIIGQITDESGVSFRRYGHGHQSALQVPQVTDVTNERGEYR